MSSILDIKRKLEKHREELEKQRDEGPDLRARLEMHREALQREAEPDTGRKHADDEEEPRLEERHYERRTETKDLGMDELLRELKNKEQKHIEELQDEISNIDELKEIINQMIKEGEEHVSELEGKLQKYGR